MHILDYYFSLFSLLWIVIDFKLIKDSALPLVIGVVFKKIFELKQIR